MKCKYCNAEMRLDDCDTDYYGRGSINAGTTKYSSMNKYWYCDNCRAGVTEYIRGGKTVKESWVKMMMPLRR